MSLGEVCESVQMYSSPGYYRERPFFLPNQAPVPQRNFFALLTRTSAEYLRLALIKPWLHDSPMQSLSVLADPTRQRIVEMLAKGALSSGEIARRFDVSAPAISQHLKTLRDAKLVRVRAQAQKRFYELDAEGFDELAHWINRIRSFWSTKLDALEQELRK
jgi:DNA-binding transcriptional ArsR family regulator